MTCLFLREKGYLDVGCYLKKTTTTVLKTNYLFRICLKQLNTGIVYDVTSFYSIRKKRSKPKALSRVFYIIYLFI